MVSNSGIFNFRKSCQWDEGRSGEYRQFVTDTAFDVVMIKAAQQWTFDALWPVLSRIPGRKVFIPCGFSCLYEPDYADYFRELPAYSDNSITLFSMHPSIATFVSPDSTDS